MTTQLRILIGMLFTLATTAALIILGIGEDARMQKTAATFHGRQVEAGADNFSTYCSTCHGVKGDGVVGKGPPINRKDLLDTKNVPYLKQIGWSGTLHDFLEDVVSAGRPQPSRYYALASFLNPMPTWSQDYGGPLRPDQVDSIVAFVENWAPGQFDQTVPVVPPGQAISTGGPTPTPAPTVAGCTSTAPAPYGCAKPPFPLPPSNEIVQAGQALYVKNCSSCHGEGGQGNGPAAGGLPKPPRNFTDCANMANFAMDLHFQRVNEGVVPSGMPAWKPILKQDEIWNVVMYERSFCKLFDATVQK